MTKPGSRVIAVRNAEGDTVWIYGYGKYVGDEHPPEGTVGCFGIDVGKIEGYTNPKIELDNGKVVWGCQCWFGPEEEIKKRMIRDRKVVEVDIDKDLEEAKKSNEPI